MKKCLILFFMSQLFCLSLFAQQTVTSQGTSITSAPLTAGTTQTVNAVIKSTVNLAGVIAEIRIVDSARNKVASKIFENLSLTSNINMTLQFNYQSPSTLAAGTYKVELGVWDSNWRTLVYTEGSSQFQVVAPAPVQTQTPPPATAPSTPPPSNYITPAISLVSISPSNASVPQGSNQAVRSVLISNSNFNDLIVSMRVYNSAHVQVLAKTFMPVNLTANVQNSLQYDFSTSSLPLGTYSMEIGVWDNSWKTYLYETAPSSFTVAAPVPVTPTISLIGVTLAKNSITQSETQTITTKLKSNVAATDLIVDVRIFDSARNKVASKMYEGVNLAANVESNLLYAASMSSFALGNYTIEVGVWDKNWNTYLYADSQAPFTVAGASTTTPPPAPTEPAPTQPGPGPISQYPTAAPMPGSLTPITTSNNLVLNPGFEYDGVGYNKDGWSNWSIDTTQPRSGKKALKVNPDGGFGTLLLGQHMKPGEKYRLTLYAKVGNPSENAFFGLRFSNVSGDLISSTQVDIKSTAYQAYTQEFVVPAGTWDMELFFYKYQGTTSIYADDIEIVQVTNPMPTKTIVPSAAPAGGVGYPFGSRKIPYVAGLRPSVSMASQDTAIKKLYDSWKALLSKRCGHYMVAFSTDKSASVSEGVSYGMLITANMAGHDPQAREYFDGLFRFARQYPAHITHPSLMDWRIAPDCSAGGGGYNAVDGDLDIAMGLLLADKQWGSNGTINYMAEAVTMISNMKLANFRYDGLSFGKGHRLSDNMIGHYKVFKKVTGDPFWDKAAAKAFEQLELAQSMSPKNLIPGWLFGYKEGSIRPSKGWEVPESAIEGEYDWNSNRIPWRLATDYVTSGDLRSKAINQKIMDFYRAASNGDPSKIAPGYKLDGTPLGNYVSLSFIGPAVAGAAADNNQAYLDAAWNFASVHPLNGYYDNELQILGLIVASGNWWNP